MPGQQVVDVIVVGAGPAGSEAARVCLGHGLTVVQLDSSRFPRVKPCAGGLTPKVVLPSLPGRDGQILRASGEFEFTAKSGLRLVFRHPGSFLRFVHRPDFDNWLVQANLGHPGFSFKPGEKATGIEFDGIFSVETTGGVYRGRLLVGADGANGITRRTYSPKSRCLYAAAVETHLPSLRNAIPAAFDFGVVDQGYGWVFPKKGTASIGLYTVASSTCGLRSRLRQYAVAKGFEWNDDAGICGHRYPVGGGPVRLPVPVFLVGDAAGLAEAVTGEGIYSAIESGRRAGAAAAAVTGGARPERFFRDLGELRRDAACSRLAARAFYRNPEFWLKVLGFSPLWRVFVEGYAARAGFSRVLLGAPVYLIRSLRRRESSIAVPR